MNGIWNHSEFQANTDRRVYKGYCNNHAWQISGKTTTSNKTTTKKKTSSGKKYEMPDCDDYDSYDDFMDDWDGCMPDGSDAEDYWENW